VSAALRGLGELELEFRRPDVSRRSVYLTAVSADRLAAVRRELRRLLELAPPRPAVVTDPLAFCNVMRFGTAGSYQALASRLRAAAPSPARVVVNSVELVETDKVLSAGGTRFLARYPLSAPSREP
jgi:hypothetical protein